MLQSNARGWGSLLNGYPAESDHPQSMAESCDGHDSYVGRTDSGIAPACFPGEKATGNSNNILDMGVSNVLNSLPMKLERGSGLSPHHLSPSIPTSPISYEAKYGLGNYVELSSLLPQPSSGEQGLSLGLQSGVENGMSVVCVIPNAKPNMKYFTQWTKAFRIYMSLYLTKPMHYSYATLPCQCNYAFVHQKPHFFAQCIQATYTVLYC